MILQYIARLYHFLSEIARTTVNGSISVSSLIGEGVKPQFT